MRKISELKLVAKGKHSKVFVFGAGRRRLALKMVSVRNVRECAQLAHEFAVLQTLGHPNIIKALKLKQNVAGKPSDTQQSRSSVMVMEFAERGSLLQELNCLSKRKPICRKFSLKNHSGLDKCDSDTGTTKDYTSDLTSSSASKCPNLAENISPCLRSARQRHTQVRSVVPLRKVIDLFTQIAGAIDYLHSKGIAHSDIKLQNILLDRNKRIKLSDFGLSTVSPQENLCSVFKGTRKGYMAPEIHNLEFQKGSYDPFKADIFALGVVLFCLVAGCLPFAFATLDDTYYSLIASHQHELFWELHEPFMSSPNLMGFQNLFSLMVDPEPAFRPCISSVLAHPWLRQPLDI